MTLDYEPIDCGIHDRLEDLALRRVRCRIRHESGEELAETQGTIVDIFAREGAELLRTDGGMEIRLDRLRAVVPLASAESTA